MNDPSELTVVDADDLPAPTGTPGVSRQVVFETDDTAMVRSRVAAGVTTGWHHNGDRHVYAYVTAGRAVLEYGPAGEQSVELSVGDFGYVPPRTVRRVVNDGPDDWVVVICFVGTGPYAVPSDEPGSAE